MFELAEAIGAVMLASRTDPRATYSLLLGLKYDGFVANQAAMALYARMEMPLPDDRSQMEFREDVWLKRLQTRFPIGRAPLERAVSASVDN